jgi:SOS-response transcriptional repressor LexA
MTAALTKKQDECLAFIQRSIDKTGTSPHFREIAEGVGISSTSGVARLVDGLEARGLIRRLPCRARGLSVVQPGERSDALAFLANDLMDAVRAFAKSRGMSLERATAEIVGLYFKDRALTRKVSA